jgi:hypothetical protein
MGPIVDRVSVVLFSGNDNNVFTDSVNIFKEHFASRNATLGHFDQFSNMTAKSNKLRISSEVKEACREIIFNHIDPLPKAA